MVVISNPNQIAAPHNGLGNNEYRQDGLASGKSNDGAVYPKKLTSLRACLLQSGRFDFSFFFSLIIITDKACLPIYQPKADRQAI